jgi:hypothetical protein
MHETVAALDALERMCAQDPMQTFFDFGGQS